MSKFYNTFYIHFFVKFWHFLLIIESVYTKLGDFVNLGVLFQTMQINIVAYAIIYRLVPSASRYEIRQLAILQLCAQLPGLWMQARLKVTFLWYRQTFLLISFKCQLVNTDENNLIYTAKVVRSVSEQSHLQPHCHCEARSLSKRL